MCKTLQGCLTMVTHRVWWGRMQRVSAHWRPKTQSEAGVHCSAPLKSVSGDPPVCNARLKSVQGKSRNDFQGGRLDHLWGNRSRSFLTYFPFLPSRWGAALGWIFHTPGNVECWTNLDKHPLTKLLKLTQSLEMYFAKFLGSSQFTEVDSQDSSPQRHLAVWILYHCFCLDHLCLPTLLILGRKAQSFIQDFLSDILDVTPPAGSVSSLLSLYFHFSLKYPYCSEFLKTFLLFSRMWY